jgi:hypothetical protein
MAEPTKSPDRTQDQPEVHPGLIDPRPEGGVGASDGNSGGGNATGIPDGDTAQRAGEAVTRGEVKDDRKKIFPEHEA